MQECPKCKSHYGDEVKICRTCGAILGAVAEELPQAVEDNPSPPATGDPHEVSSAETTFMDVLAMRSVRAGRLRGLLELWNEQGWRT